jgi:hypothetical protein
MEERQMLKKVSEVRDVRDAKSENMTARRVDEPSFIPEDKIERDPPAPR